MDRVADTLASVQSLCAAFRVPAAALQQPDLGAVADQLAGDADPGRPGPDDADVRLDLLVVGQLPRVRQHPGAPPYPQHFGGLAGVARLAVRPGLLRVLISSNDRSMRPEVAELAELGASGSTRLSQASFQ